MTEVPEAYIEVHMFLSLCCPPNWSHRLSLNISRLSFMNENWFQAKATAQAPAEP